MIDLLQGLTLDRPLVFFDLETTGTDPSTDRIVEMTFIPIRNPRRRYSCLVHPGINIPKAATDCHGITDAMISGIRGFDFHAHDLLRFLDGADLAGFNIRRFDLKLLCSEFRRCGIEFPLAGRRVIDVMEIFHKYNKRDLTAAVKHYMGEDHAGHRSEVDTLATARVLAEQIKRHDLPTTVEGLAELTSGDYADIGGVFVKSSDLGLAFAFGKHKGRLLTDIAGHDRSYLTWMLTQDFYDDAKSIIRKALG